MENQHKLIKGYRDLSQEEIEAMNECKAMEQQVADLTKKVKAISGIDQRNAALAVTSFEDAFMRLVRSIARPYDPYRD